MRAHAAPVGAGDDRVADLQRAALDEHGDDGAAARVELGLDDHAGGLGVRVGLELLDLGEQQDRLRAGRRGSVLVLAETSTNIVSPPHSSGCRPRLVISVRTRSGCAPSLSILLTATRIGTSAAFAWSIASRVCGFTPSSAATTITAMSVTWAPRARMAVNASWPGVSRKVIGLVVVVDLVGADVLGDAAGLARGHLGLADRVQQRRLAVVDVAHDRDDRRARSRAPRRRPRTPARRPPRRRRGRSRSPCRTRPRCTWIASSDSVCVSVAISPRPISFLMISGTGDAEVLGDVLDRRAGVDPDRVGLQDADVLRRRLRVGAATPAAAARAAGGAAGRRRGRRRDRRRDRRAARGLRVDHDAAHAAAGAGGALALQRGARRPRWCRRRCRRALAVRRLAASPAASLACRAGARGARRRAVEADAACARAAAALALLAWRRCSTPWASACRSARRRPARRPRRWRQP